MLELTIAVVVLGVFIDHRLYKILKAQREIAEHLRVMREGWEKQNSDLLSVDR